MEHVSLDITVLTIISMILLSKFLNDKFRIPLPHTLIIFSFTIHHFYPGFLNLSANENFDETLFLLIPIILMVDAIHLKWEYIKKHYASMIYLAAIAIILSVILGAFIGEYLGLLGTTAISFGLYISLFAIINATDAVSVNSIFAQFKNVGHDTKVLIESESLGNDAVTFTILMLVGIPMSLAVGEFNYSALPLTILYNVTASFLIGSIIGYAFYIITMFFEEEKEEFFIMLGVAFASFTLAEVFHFAGIFSLIVAVILFKTLIDKNIELHSKKMNNNEGQLTKYKMFQQRATTKERHHNTLILAENIAFIGVVILFVAMSEMIHLDTLLEYKMEILIAFAITTFTRFLTIGIFSLLSKKLKMFVDLGLAGWITLSLAGIKGGLSIIMVHALKGALGPEYADIMVKIESIVIGVIILSIFVYGLLLLFYMLNKKKD
jgi:CPA1 family monovalent cation:H+ antiporter